MTTIKRRHPRIVAVMMILLILAFSIEFYFMENGGTLRIAIRLITILLLAVYAVKAFTGRYDEILSYDDERLIVEKKGKKEQVFLFNEFEGVRVISKGAVMVFPKEAFFFARSEFERSEWDAFADHLAGLKAIHGESKFGL